MALFTIEMWARVADARAYLVDYRICVGGRVSSWLMIYVCINTYNMEIQQALASSLQGDPSLAKARSTRLGMVSNTATDTKHASALFLCLFFSPVKQIHSDMYTHTTHHSWCRTGRRRCTQPRRWETSRPWSCCWRRPTRTPLQSICRYPCGWVDGWVVD